MKDELTEEKAVEYARKALIYTAIVSAIALFLVFFFFKYCITCGKSNYSIAESGQFGDTFNGVLGPIIAVLAAVLTFLAFFMQYKANKRQDEQIGEQRKSWEIERFEDKLFLMIQLHADNVKEIGIGDSHGKKVFVKMLRELRAIREIIDNIFITEKAQYSREQVLGIAYLAFYYGVGPNSTRILIKSLEGICSEEIINRITKTLDTKEMKEKVKAELRFNFTPFEGHQSRLGHYYRHLYQTIEFVDSNDKLNPDEKYKYVKTVRAQLSNHEQALLFYNSLSKLGRSWSAEGLITKYKLIKNLPQSFIDEKKEIDVKKVYPDIVFEWEDK